MKQKAKAISCLFTLVLLLVSTAMPTAALRGPDDVQERNINVNERLDFRALGIDNEARQLVSLGDAQVKFFKRGAELKRNGALPEGNFSDEANSRKSELLTIKRHLESIINKLKQKNQWNDAFDAQFLASLKNSSDQSALTQAGGARKVLQAGVDDVGSLRGEIEEEVRQVKSRQTGAMFRVDRAFAAPASPMFTKVGCNLLLSLYYTALFVPDGGATACAVARRYNDKGCGAKINNPGCN
jgi:hypothetical protein